MSVVKWPVSIAQNYYQLSYRIVETGGETRHTVKTLGEAIRITGEAVRNVVWTGWSMFHQFTRASIAPRVVIDAASGKEVEAIETNLLGETILESTVPDLWRITVDGRSSIVRPYREDRMVIPHLSARGLIPGKYISPRILIRELYEFATHAKELAKAFPHASKIEFHCSWFGLEGRRIADMEPDVEWGDYVCHVNNRSSSATVTLDELAADTVSVVATLAAPVLNLFDGFEISRDWIARQVPKFRML